MSKSHPTLKDLQSLAPTVVKYRGFQIVRMNSYTERRIICSKKGEFMAIRPDLAEAKLYIDFYKGGVKAQAAAAENI